MLDLPSKFYRVIFSLTILVFMLYTVCGQVGNGEARLLTFRSTCYCHGSKQCKIRSAGITKTGTKVERGVLAADPLVLKMGTHVEIIEPEDYAGLYRVEDTGRLIRKNRLDLWAPTQEECRQFGVRKVVLRVLKK